MTAAAAAAVAAVDAASVADPPPALDAHRLPIRTNRPPPIRFIFSKFEFLCEIDNDELRSSKIKTRSSGSRRDSLRIQHCTVARHTGSLRSGIRPIAYSRCHLHAMNVWKYLFGNCIMMSFSFLLPAYLFFKPSALYFVSLLAIFHITTVHSYKRTCAQCTHTNERVPVSSFISGVQAHTTPLTHKEIIFFFLECSSLFFFFFYQIPLLGCATLCMLNQLQSSVVQQQCNHMIGRG